MKTRVSAFFYANPPTTALSNMPWAEAWVPPWWPNIIASWFPRKSSKSHWTNFVRFWLRKRNRFGTPNNRITTTRFTRRYKSSANGWRNAVGSHSFGFSTINRLSTWQKDFGRLYPMQRIWKDCFLVETLINNFLIASENRKFFHSTLTFPIFFYLCTFIFQRGNHNKNAQYENN